MDTIRIAIADDHKLFREGMGMILQTVAQFDVLYDAEDGVQLLERMSAEGALLPDVVLLDLKMPNKDGLETTKELIAKYPSIRILILTMLDDDDYILHSLDNGAHGYLLKDTSADEMKNAIMSVHKEGYYFSHRVSQVMLKGLKRKPSAPSLGDEYHITNREQEVLQLICQEMTTTAIADKLFLSVRTVESHRKNVMEKIGAKNTAGLVFRAIKAGLVD